MEAKNRVRIHIKDEDIKDILFRNFSGGPDRYNPNGCMANFWIVLNDEDYAKSLEDKNLNVRWKPNRDGDLEPRLQLFMRWDKYPPVIFKKSGDQEIQLNETTLGTLDYDDIAHADIWISPNNYDPNKPAKSYIAKAKFYVEDDEWDD